MISHDLKCIFIHIPKAAGTSIEQKLGHFKQLSRGVQDHRTIRQLQPITLLDLFNRGPRTTSHFSHGALLKTFIRQRIKEPPPITPHQYHTYYRFTFVRNPWSRAFSWYKNVMRDKIHQAELSIPEHCSFKDFLFKYPNQWALMPQLHWIVDSQGNLPYHFIGRFENLSSDFAKVCEDLEIEDKTLPKLVSGSSTENYCDFYDEGMKKLLSEKYADEIELFNFKFGE